MPLVPIGLNWPFAQMVFITSCIMRLGCKAWVHNRLFFALLWKNDIISNFLHFNFLDCLALKSLTNDRNGLTTYFIDSAHAPQILLTSLLLANFAKHLLNAAGICKLFY